MSTVDDIPLDNILDRYDQRQKLYNDFMSRQVTLLQEFIKENGPPVYSIQGRVKERDSVRRKLLAMDPAPTRLDDVADIVGIRIVTYFESEVDRIADIIQREFKINSTHMVDRGEALDPERFGYLSRHYSVSMLDNRLELIEYKRFKGIRAEVQVRSLLQHAWAEIQVQMGYDSQETFPKERRREFSRIAGLLELADEQYNEIKTFLKPFEETTLSPASDLPLDSDTLGDVIRSNRIVTELDDKLSNLLSVPVVPNENFLNELVENLAYLGIETVAALENELKKRKKSILSIGTQILDRESETHYASLWEGISILFVCYSLAAVSGRVDQILEFLQKTPMGKEIKKDEEFPDIGDEIGHW
ncbi:MAG: hypothetical protein HQL50_04210 [Magnetococcales bacterium]|nr:hypothetical protein [Magnetococcales bacterium]